MRLQVFDALDGSFIQSLNIQLYPYGLALTHGGKIVVSGCDQQDNQHCVQVFQIIQQ
jgi:DNA-binding beta-propeller fold protein YncE